MICVGVEPAVEGNHRVDDVLESERLRCGEDLVVREHRDDPVTKAQLVGQQVRMTGLGFEAVPQERLGQGLCPIDEGVRLHLSQTHLRQLGQGAVRVCDELVVDAVELDRELRLGHG